MSNFGQDDPSFFQGNYGADGYDSQSQGYDMGSDQFPQDPQFQSFDYSQPTGAPAGYSDNPYYTSGQPAYTGSTIMTPDPVSPYGGEITEDFDNEPPLMEELGINFDHITQKTLTVLNPLKEASQEVMQDTDLAGPLVFCLAFGGSLLLSGKVQFGYIYGLGLVGCLAMYALLNLMSMTGVSASCIVSVLGYCLLPMIILSFLAVVISLKGVIGIVATSVTVLWCSVSASKLFTTALVMDHQQLLVAYPCALVYGVFALLTVF